LTFFPVMWFREMFSLIKISQWKPDWTEFLNDPIFTK
jgi:hypothetical protein